MENYKQTKRFENFVRLSVLFFVVIVCVTVFSFVRVGSARRKNERYNELIAQLTSENNQINQSINSIDNEYYENMARDELGMIKNGETYIEFQ